MTHHIQQLLLITTSLIVSGRLCAGVAPPPPVTETPTAVPAPSPKEATTSLVRERFATFTATGRKLKKENAAVQETAAEQAVRADLVIEGIDLALLKLSVLADISEVARTSPAARERFQKDLRARAERKDAQGFQAAVLNATLDGTTTLTRSDLVTLLERPAAAEGIASEIGVQVLPILLTLDTQTLLSHADLIQSLADRYSSNPSSALLSKADTFVEVARAGLPVAQANAVHASVLAAVKSKMKSTESEIALLQAKTEEPADRTTETTDTDRTKSRTVIRLQLAQMSLRRVEQRLETPVGRGSLVGQVAPPLQCDWVRNAEGNEPWKELSNLHGKVVVLDFWATWCGPCVAAFPHMVSLRAKYPADKVEIIGITSLQGKVSHRKRPAVDCKNDPQREHDELLTFMKEMGMTWTVAVTHENVFNPAYGVVGIPAVVILDQEGKVARAGMKAKDEAGIIATIDGLLASQKKAAPSSQP